MSNLPNWPGASAVYRKAYALLERMAQSGHVRRIKRGRSWQCNVSQDMRELMDALKRGDEHDIKSILLQRIDYSDSVKLSV
jgi:hypothetical protein